ncbi:MAG: uroporphyrinogen-III synthase [Nitrospira sp.]|nr:uroporphyrinogen-III synthase [Nitrospira sp.]
MTEADHPDQLKAQTRQFAVGVLKLFGSLPRTAETLAIQPQLVKAAAVLAASCRAIERAKSEDERQIKLSVASADADDAVFWLDLLRSADLEEHQLIHQLLNEATDILAILSNRSVTEQTAPARTANQPQTAIPSPSPALPTDFNRLRVASFESRMATEITRLIERQGGTPLVVPALQEHPIPLQENTAVLRLGVKLILGQIDILILLTGTGTSALFDLLRTRYAQADLTEALTKILVVTRGPKSFMALKKTLNLEANITVPEPNTWVEVISTLDEYRPVKGLRVAVQEYGTSNPELLEALKQRGAEVFPVPIYRWKLPDDTGPLKQALGEILAGQVPVMLITNAAQVDHVMQLLEQEGNTAQFKDICKKMVVGSIGPSASERLRHYDLPVDIEPSHSKMGVLVKEVSERAHTLLQHKQSA